MVQIHRDPIALQRAERIAQCVRLGLPAQPIDATPA